MFTRYSYLFFLILMVAAASISGCSGTGSSSQLDKTSWVLTEWSISSLAPTDFNITASFADGQISGRSAVNSYSGAYLADSVGSFSTSNIAMTLMAGPEPAMRAESAYFELLAQASHFNLSGSNLTLLDSNNNPLLIFTASN